MPDLRKLEAATLQADIDRWFPPAYSDDHAVRLEQRQTACKEFIFGPLRTTDAQERVIHPVKPIPRLPYLEHWVDGLIRESNVLGPKVRRMIMTLTAEAYVLWRIMERPGTYVAVVHATHEVGSDHVDDDIKNTMFDALPAGLKDQFNLAQAKGQVLLTDRKDANGKWKKWDSWIVPYVSGDRKLESFGHAVVLWDEFASFPGAREACKGIVPTLFGRTLDPGQLIRMGTVNPNTSSGKFYRELYEAHNLRRARMLAKYGVDLPEVA